jgi:hypothetical protein
MAACTNVPPCGLMLRAGGQPHCSRGSKKSQSEQKVQSQNLKDGYCEERQEMELLYDGLKDDLKVQHECRTNASEPQKLWLWQ